MPLPNTPFTLCGGCMCRSVRYQIIVPAFEERPLNPTDRQKQARLPVVATDSCNTCRQATGAVLPIWMCVPADMLQMKLAPWLNGPPAVNEEAAAIDKQTLEPTPTSEAFLLADTHIYPSSSPSPSSTTLRTYPSSPGVTRSFCGLCGTSLTFSRKPMTAGYPDMFDVLLGTLDREWVEQDWLAPERHFWLSCEIPWVNRILLGGGLPRYSRSRLEEGTGGG
ncbi:MAG: hypothetical protein MMC23_007055 [Stictis urceolatum]|nr:hypothetical protein [Stictis urceolata]